jgi:hypothetical protein
MSQLLKSKRSSVALAKPANWLLLGCLAVTCPSLLAKVSMLPQIYQSYRRPQCGAETLKKIVLQRGEIPLILAERAMVSIVRGDVMKVEQVELEGCRGEALVPKVYLVGEGVYRELIPGEPFQTEGLQAGQGLGRGKQIFVLVVVTPGLLHGYVYLNVEELKLSELVVEINGETRKLFPAQGIQVRPQDQFRIVRAITNLHDSSDIAVTIRRWDDGERFDFELKRGDQRFAIVPVKLLKP